MIAPLQTKRAIIVRITTNPTPTTAVGQAMLKAAQA